MKEFYTEGPATTVTSSDALATRKGAAKRSKGHMQARLLSREIRNISAQ